MNLKFNNTYTFWVELDFRGISQHEDDYNNGACELYRYLHDNIDCVSNSDYLYNTMLQITTTDISDEFNDSLTIQIINNTKNWADKMIKYLNGRIEDCKQSIRDGLNDDSDYLGEEIRDYKGDIEIYQLLKKEVDNL